MALFSFQAWQTLGLLSSLLMSSHFSSSLWFFLSFSTSNLFLCHLFLLKSLQLHSSSLVSLKLGFHQEDKQNEIQQLNSGSFLKAGCLLHHPILMGCCFNSLHALCSIQCDVSLTQTDFLINSLSDQRQLSPKPLNSHQLPEIIRRSDFFSKGQNSLQVLQFLRKSPAAWKS